MRNDWKGGAFGDQAETWCEGNSPKSIRMTPAKAPSNSGFSNLNLSSPVVGLVATPVIVLEPSFSDDRNKCRDPRGNIIPSSGNPAEDREKGLEESEESRKPRENLAHRNSRV